MHKLTRALLALSLLALFPHSAPAAAAKPDPAVAGRHYDLRQTLGTSGTLASDPAQEAAIARLRAAAPGLVVDRDARTGAVRSLGNLGGYLSGPRQGGDIETLALDFVRQQLGLLGLAASDLDDYEVTDVVPSSSSSLTHVYLRQRHAGIPVYNGQLQINMMSDGRVLSVHNQFLPQLAAAVNATEAAISVPEAVASLTAHIATNPADLSITPPPRASCTCRSARVKRGWSGTSRSRPPTASTGTTSPSTPLDGRVWTRLDWVAADTYKVYQMPVESPYYSVPPTPGDGRTRR